MDNASIQSIIYSVLQKKSIVDYLERKGHQPVKTLTGGKLLYLCPFPDHDESKPSFTVYTQSEYENFYCFGCQRSHSIIQLVAGLESLSFKEALTRLSDGMDINYLEGVDLEVERINKEFQRSSISLQTSEELMSISTMCRMYLNSVGRDKTETKIVDKLFAVVDKSVQEADFSDISETATSLPMLLMKRREKYEKIKIERMRKEHAKQSSK